MVVGNKWAFNLLREVDINKVVRFDHTAFSEDERFSKTLVNVIYHVKEQFSSIYCSSRNSRQIIDAIDTTDFDYSLMEKVLCPVVYLIDKDSFFFIEQADRIPAILSAASVYNYSRNDIFLIYASSCRNETPLPDELRLIQLADTERNARNFDTLHFCLKFIIYVEFFDQSQRVVVTPHSKRTLESHEAKILNNSGLYVTLVDTLWNTELMFINGTMVKGFFRWQRYGTGRKKTRYIYIAPFYIGAYKRRSRKAIRDGVS